MPDDPLLESISAITLATHDMARSVAFYRGLGFRVRFGGEGSAFTSFHVGKGYLNIVQADPSAEWGWWGRTIFYVSDVDAQYQRARESGFMPDFEPRDARWGERYFHLRDPDGHELSFARPLDRDVSDS